MHSTILLAKKNKELHGENEKNKQKCTQSRRQIPSEEGLSVLEVSALIMQQQEANEAPPSGPGMHGESSLQPRTRPPRQCGICRLPGHIRETCPDRQIS